MKMIMMRRRRDGRLFGSLEKNGQNKRPAQADLKEAGNKMVIKIGGAKAYPAPIGQGSGNPAEKCPDEVATGKPAKGIMQGHGKLHPENKNPQRWQGWVERSMGE